MLQTPRPDATDFYALAVLALPMLSLLVLARWGTRPRHWLAFGLTALVLFGLLMVFMPVFAHSPQSPVLPPAIGAACGAAFAWCARPPVLRVIGIFFTWGATLGPHLFWLGLSSRAYTQDHPHGSARAARWQAETALRHLKSGDLVALARDDLRPGERLPPGFLSEGWYRQHNLHHFVGNLRRVERRPMWHTWLTGLASYRVVRLDLWTPGGTPEEAARGLELRERSAS